MIKISGANSEVNVDKGQAKVNMMSLCTSNLIFDVAKATVALIN